MLYMSDLYKNDCKLASVGLFSFASIAVYRNICYAIPCVMMQIKFSHIIKVFSTQNIKDFSIQDKLDLRLNVKLSRVAFSRDNNETAMAPTPELSFLYHWSGFCSFFLFSNVLMCLKLNGK